MATPSSSEPTRTTGATGPKVSRRTMSMAGVAWSSTVGAMRPPAGRRRPGTGGRPARGRRRPRPPPGGGGLVDHRTDVGVGIEGIAPAQAGGELDQPFDEVVRHRVLDQDPADGGAALAGVVEGAQGDPGGASTSASASTTRAALPPSSGT